MKETKNMNIFFRIKRSVLIRVKLLSEKIQFYRYKHFTVGYGLTNKPRNPKIIVTLTSYPKRLDNIYITIRSLMNQKIKADKIMLFLGSDSKDYQLNKELVDLKNKGLEIIYLDEDLKSHKKYYYVMQEYPNDLIITADDDLVYDKDFIDKLYESYLENPNCIHAYRVHRYKFNNKQLAPYAEWEFECNYINEPSQELFFTTGAGVLFPPNLLPKEIFNKKNIIDLCFYADDVWINFFALLSSVKTKWVKSRSQLPTVNNEVQETSLNVSNLYNGGNDLFLKNLISFYEVDFYEKMYGTIKEINYEK